MVLLSIWEFKYRDFGMIQESLDFKGAQPPSCSRWFHGSGVSTLFFSINLENPISVLYSTKFHPQRNTFLPFPRPLWGTLAHPERTGAALDSSKANAPPWYFSAARLRGPSGETTAHRDLLRGCWPKSVQQTTWNCENHASRVRVRSVSVK